MYSLSDLKQEIEQTISAMESQSRLHPEWITQAVMSKHSDVEGNDTDFYQCCARAEVRTQVRKRLSQYKASADTTVDRQIVLEGFERLQKRYLIAENGEQVAIRIQDMTEEQLQVKANEYRAMGVGCFQHADEIDRYREQLRQQAEQEKRLEQETA